MTTPPDRLTEDHELFERYRRTGDLAARDALVERFLPLARISPAATAAAASPPRTSSRSPRSGC